MRTASFRHVRAERHKSTEQHDIELEIASLFAELSHVYEKTILLTKKLKSKGCRQSSIETFEIGIMLKNALRIFADAMSHLPT